MRMPEEEDCLPRRCRRVAVCFAFALAFAFAFHRVPVPLAICCVLTRGIVGPELVISVASNNWAFLCAGTPKGNQVRFALSLALQTGEAVFCFLDTAYHSRLAVLCTNRISRPTSLGAGDPLACSDYPAGLSPPTTTHYLLPIRPHSPANSASH
jgi:hypothetical protein